MKHILITTIAAVVLVGCVGVSKTELLKNEEGNLLILPVEPVPEAATPEQPKAKAPGRSIHRAAMNGNIEAVKQHLDAGTDVNAKDVIKRTPLHYAAFYGHKVVAELLIAEGADVNAKNGLSGETPLHHAAYGGHKEIVELLIANGADVNAKSESKNRFFKGRTPLDSAEYNPETADLLRKHGGKTGEELKAAAN